MPVTETIARPAKCQRCDRTLRVPILCDGCHTLYPAAQAVDHFSLLGLPRRFDLDPQQLHQAYIAISRNIHPDYFGGQPPEMQRLALRLSAAVNEARAVLSDPLLRAEYLLETAGGKSAAEDKRVPPELLGEVMMLREELEETRRCGDAGAVETIRAQVRRRAEATMSRVAGLARGVTEDPGEGLLDELRLELNAMKYLNNLLSEL